MKRTLWLLVAWGVMSTYGTTVHATTININDIMVAVDPPGTPKNIGNITATTTDVGNANGDVKMTASFNLSAELLLLCSSLHCKNTFHWLQVITHATSNLEYPKGTSVTTGGQPVIDTPNGGYFFQTGDAVTHPPDGYIRTPAGEDALPWYLTGLEESQAGNSTPGVPGGIIRDSPTVTAATFDTYLVATDPDDGPTTFFLIAGFMWETGADGTAANLATINVGNNDLTLLNGAAGNGTGALTFSGFGDWKAELAANDDIDIPEPGSLALLLGGCLALGLQIRRKCAA